MDKCWYIIVEGATLGPFTEEELAAHPGFSPDALVWRDGFAGWTPAREVEELKTLFRDKGAPPPLPLVEPEEDRIEVGDEAVLSKSEPPFLIIWFTIAALILIYLLFQIFFDS